MGFPFLGSCYLSLFLSLFFYFIFIFLILKRECGNGEFIIAVGCVRERIVLWYYFFIYFLFFNVCDLL